MISIRYREGYKYQLAEDYEVDTGITLVVVGDWWHAKFQEMDIILPWVDFGTDDPDPLDVEDRFINFTPAGHLFMRADYAWDGPSGPTFDTANFMRGSLEHDGFYQLMRERVLPPEFRPIADSRLEYVCLQDGMSWLRAHWVHAGVRIGGASATDPRPNEVLTAP